MGLGQWIDRILGSLEKVGTRNIANLQGFPQGCDVLLAPVASNVLCAVARLHGALPITHDVWGKKQCGSLLVSTLE